MFEPKFGDVRIHFQHDTDPDNPVLTLDAVDVDNAIMMLGAMGYLMDHLFQIGVIGEFREATAVTRFQIGDDGVPSWVNIWPEISERFKEFGDAK